MRRSKKDSELSSLITLADADGFFLFPKIQHINYTTKSRKGVKTMNITDKTGKLVALKVVNDEDDLMIINVSGITLRLHTSVY